MDYITAAEWGKKKKTRSLKLPSGVVIEIKASTMYPLLASNLLPMTALSKVVKDQEAGTDEDKVDLVLSLNRMLVLLQQIVVSPRLCLEGEPKAGEISITDIPDEDIQYLIRYVVRGQEADALTSFPDGALSGDRGPDLQAVSPASVNGAGHEP